MSMLCGATRRTERTETSSALEEEGHNDVEQQKEKKLEVKEGSVRTQPQPITEPVEEEEREPSVKICNDCSVMSQQKPARKERARAKLESSAAGAGIKSDGAGVSGGASNVRS